MTLDSLEKNVSNLTEKMAAQDYILEYLSLSLINFDETFSTKHYTPNEIKRLKLLTKKLLDKIAKSYGYPNGV
jgi:uncharacterized coiled-coil protein SlyX